MNTNNSSQENADGVSWRYCYECVSPATGACLRVPGEAEAYFWYLLGYRVHRLLQRVA